MWAAVRPARRFMANRIRLAVAQINNPAMPPAVYSLERRLIFNRRNITVSAGLQILLKTNSPKAV